MHYPDNYRNLSSIERQATWNKIQGTIELSTVITKSPYANTAHIRKTFLSRDYAIGLLSVLLLSSTTSVFAAADRALPTSSLYSIKLNVTEPLRSLTKTTPEDKINWDIERTSRRLEETRKLIETNTLTPEIVQQISEHIQEHTAAAQSEIHDLSATDSNQSTLLSLSLVETIEKKQEEIIISSKQSQSNSVDNTSNIVPVENNTFANSTTVISTGDTSTVSQTDSGQIALLITEQILSVTDQIQKDTNTLIQTIATEQEAIKTPKDNSIQTVISEETNQDASVITYSLIMKDIQDKANTIQKLLGIESAPEGFIVDQPDDLLPPDEASDILTTTEPPKNIPTTTTTEVTPIDPAQAITEPSLTNTIVPTTISTEPAPPSETTEPSLGLVLQTPTETELRELTFGERYMALLEKFVALQKVTEPSHEDILTARTVRKSAEQLINDINQTKKVEAVSNTDVTLPSISTESVNLPLLESKSTPVQEAKPSSLDPLPFDAVVQIKNDLIPSTPDLNIQ